MQQPRGAIGSSEESAGGLCLIDEGSALNQPNAPLLTIDQAAEYLAIPKATLYTWRTRRAGFGPRAVKIGGNLRFRRCDLDAWIDAHLETQNDDATGKGPDESRRGKTAAVNALPSLTRESRSRRS